MREFEAIKVFTPPFVYDPEGGCIIDAEGRIVCDFHSISHHALGYARENVSGVQFGEWAELAEFCLAGYFVQKLNELAEEAKSHG